MTDAQHEAIRRAISLARNDTLTTRSQYGSGFSDPRVCPTCGWKATTVVGARAYCTPCAASMRAFLEGHRTYLPVDPLGQSVQSGTRGIEHGEPK